MTASISTIYQHWPTVGSSQYTHLIIDAENTNVKGSRSWIIKIHFANINQYDINKLPFNRSTLFHLQHFIVWTSSFVSLVPKTIIRMTRCEGYIQSVPMPIKSLKCVWSRCVASALSMLKALFFCSGADDYFTFILLRGIPTEPPMKFECNSLGGWH